MESSEIAQAALSPENKRAAQAQEYKESPRHRAFQHAKIRRIRIPLEEIGFCRIISCTGQCAFDVDDVSGYHAHSLAYALTAQMLRFARSTDLSLIEIPENLLEHMKRQNIRLCEQDALLPSFSPKMKYMAVRKQHLIAAAKLCSEKSHTLYNDPDGPSLEFTGINGEHNLIRRKGVLANIYYKSIWADLPAVLAIQKIDTIESIRANLPADLPAVLQEHQHNRKDLSMCPVELKSEKKHSTPKGVNRTLAKRRRSQAPKAAQAARARRFIKPIVVKPCLLGDGGHILCVSTYQFHPTIPTFPKEGLVALWPQYSISSGEPNLDDSPWLKIGAREAWISKIVGEVSRGKPLARLLVRSLRTKIMVAIKQVRQSDRQFGGLTAEFLESPPTPIDSEKDPLDGIESTKGTQIEVDGFPVFVLNHKNMMLIRVSYNLLVFVRGVIVPLASQSACNAQGRDENGF